MFDADRMYVVHMMDYVIMNTLGREKILNAFGVGS
jgi:hypothetical protein